MLNHQADVLSIDSFVRTHEVNENDNSAMLEVVECFEEIALGRPLRGASVAPHPQGQQRRAGSPWPPPVGPEPLPGRLPLLSHPRDHDRQGARAAHRDCTPTCCRPGSTSAPSTESATLPPPAEHSDWFKLENVDLLNGDAIGVATAWAYPATMEDIPPEIVEHILADIDRGLADGRRYSNHNRATRRQAWPLVYKHCPTKTEGQCRRAVAGTDQAGRALRRRISRRGAPGSPKRAVCPQDGGGLA